MPKIKIKKMENIELTIFEHQVQLHHTPVAIKFDLVKKIVGWCTKILLILCFIGALIVLYRVYNTKIEIFVVNRDFGNLSFPKNSTINQNSTTQFPVNFPTTTALPKDNNDNWNPI